MSEIPKIQRLISIFWPSFLTAGVATILFFVFFDPADLLAILGATGGSRIAVYTIGFFLFWALTALSCMLTCYFQRPCIVKPSSGQADGVS